MIHKYDVLGRRAVAPAGRRPPAVRGAGPENGRKRWPLIEAAGCPWRVHRTTRSGPDLIAASIRLQEEPSAGPCGA